MERIIAEAQDLWGKALKIWSDGGWAMVAIAVIAFAMFARNADRFYRI